MLRTSCPNLGGTVTYRLALRHAICFALAIAVLAIVPSVSHAEFGVTGFSVTPSTKQAGAHPNLTVAFNRSGTNSEDLRDFSIDYAPGQLFNPEAATTKCTSTQFALDACPSASVVGDFTVNANLEILGFSFPTTANGTAYVLAPSGLDHATLGYVLRPTAYAKTFSKQAVQIRTDSDGGQRTITTNIPRSQSLTWPRLWGSTNIAIKKMTLRYNARANAAKTGPFFTLNPTSCSTSTTQLNAVSYAGATASSTYAYTPTGCTTVPFTPSMSVAMDNPTSGEYTGGTFTVDIPQADAAIQQSSVKSVSALLPSGSGLNFALLGTYAAGCLESELLADACPQETLVGSATANVPFYPPAFSGEVYVMDPIGLEVNGAVVLRGPRGMKSIIRFTNTVQGGGATSRVLSTWDYVPHFPWSQFQMHISEPLIKNPGCPGGAKTTDATFTSYSGRTRTLSPSYTTTCPVGSAPPVITDPPSGTSTNDSTPAISGTATAGATVTVYDGAASIGTTTADAAGSWTFTPASSIGEGLSSITATATDGSGTSTPSPAVLITVDSVAPPAPAITTGGGATNDNTPSFGGTAEPNSTVVIYDGAIALGSTTANASGIWSFTASTLSDGDYSITATSTDSATNTSPASAALALSVDTVVPDAPAITSPADGSSTNDNTPTISGTAEAGASVRVYRSGSTLVCTATATAAGAWGCDASPALPSGTYSLTATATDAAGNASAASAAVSLMIGEDPVPPVPVITSPLDGAITNDSTPTFSGSAQAGSLVTVLSGGVTTVCSATTSAAGSWTCTASPALSDGVKSITATATNAGGSSAQSPARSLTIDTVLPPGTAITSPPAGSITNDNTPVLAGTAEANSTVTVSEGAATYCVLTATGAGAWSCNLPPLPDGVHTICVTATDAAGNISPPVCRTFTVDTTPPPAPVINNPVSPTNDNTPTISGSAEPNSTVVVYDGAAALGSTTANATGAWSFTPTPLADGAHSLTARATDAASNTGPASTGRIVVIDTVAPAAPVITSPPAGSVTSDTTPTFSGTAEANSAISAREGATVVCTTTTSAAGTWSCTLAPLPDGSHTICVTATDAAGNVSAQACRTFVIDTIPPPMPVIITPAEGAVLNSGNVTFTGVAEAGASAVLRVDGTTVCTFTVPSGTWTCSGGPFGEGAHSVCLIVTDPAGNPSTACRNFMIDTIPPAAPTISAPALGAPIGDNTPTISGTAEPNSTIHVRDGATLICTTTTSAAGTWSCTPAVSLSDGSHSICVTATDGAGNVSASTCRIVIIDTTPPPAPVITSPANGTVSNDPTPTISGFAEDGSGVTVYSNGIPICTMTATGGSFSCTSSPLVEGTYSFTAIACDAAGNCSPPSASVTYVAGIEPPPPPVITSPAEGAVVTDTTPTIEGSADPGSLVTVREGATTICTATAVGGSWSCSPGTPLTFGLHTINAMAIDLAGNVSGPSASVSFTVGGDPELIQITTGPEGGLPIDISHWQLWYDGGVDPNTGLTIDPHPAPQWSFTGSPSAQYECSLVPASEPNAFAPCASPFTAPFESLDDSNPAGTDYRFTVRYADYPALADMALFKVGQFDPSWSVDLSTYQAMDHPDMTITANNPFGDPENLYASTPDHFWGSLAAIPVKCSLASAQAGTCATTAPDSKIGSITFTADVNPNPHNTMVPPHQVTRTFDTYLTPATRPGDAAGMAVSIRAIDEAAYGSLDYGTINYVARLKLRYEENRVHPDDTNPFYAGVSDPTGMDIVMEDIPNSTLPGPGITAGPAGAADLHVRSISATVLGDAPWYDAPLLWNASQCDIPGTFDAIVVSSTGTAVSKFQDYQATGCENLPYEPVVTQFDVSDNGATDLISDIDVGVSFPAGSSTTRSAIVDLPREFIANTPAVQACLSADVTVADPQANCPDTANLGTATATSPLLPYPLTGDVIGEDVGGTLPNIYMVFKDPDIGLDTRIRGSAFVMKTGTGSNSASGDFIRTTMNVGSDGSALDLPSLPLNGLELNLHQEDPGVTLPDGSTSLGSIIKVGTNYACNDTAAARFIMQSWSGATRELISPVVNFDCAANGQTVANNIGIVSGPANGEVVTTDSVTFVIRNNFTAAVRLRTGLDNGDNALSGLPYDSNIEPNAAPTPSTAAGATRTVTYSGLQDGKVYKFLVQNNTAFASLDQERRVFKVQLATGPSAPPVITSPADGAITNDNTVAIIGTADPSCTVVVYDGPAALGSTSVSAAGDWSFTTSPLTDGAHPLTARCNDPGGNESPPSSTRTVTVDTVSPAAPAITAPSAGAVVADSTPAISGTAESGSTVTVRFDSTTVACTAVASGGVFSCNSSPVIDGSHTADARACDAAGNCSPWSPPVSFIVDSVPITGPTITTPAAGSVTNDVTPQFTGTAEAGASVTVNLGATVICSTVAAADGSWSCSASSAMSDGFKSVTATASDGLGSATSPPRTFTVDSVPPAAPVITSPVAGTSTNDVTPTYSGTAEANSTVLVYDGATAIGSTTVSAAGAWSFTPAAPLSEGAHAISVRAVDAATNMGPAATRTITVDTTAPAAPVITSPVEGETGMVTNVVGTAEAGSTVAVRENSVVLCTATTSAGGGWLCTPVDPFSNAVHLICASATDAAGNTGAQTCVSFGGTPPATVQILTGPEGGLPVDITHDATWYNGGTYPGGSTVGAHKDPQWDFTGGGAGASHECSLVKASEADSFAPCTSPFQAPFESLDDTVASGTDYRFSVRVAGNPASADTALFKVGPFNPTWSVDLSTYQAMANPDMTLTANNPFGDARKLVASSPDYFWGSLAAITTKCTIASAQAGTCADTAPGSKVGSITFTADVNPNPHNDSVPPHQVTRTFDGYLTPALVPGDAAGLAVSIRAIDDPAYGSLDYGTINYIARMKLRYDGPGGSIDYTSVTNPRGMDVILDDIPNSTLPAPGVTPGPAGAADLHVRSISAQVAGDGPAYASPLLYNSSDCASTGAFDSTITSGANSTSTATQSYQATGCETLEYNPVVTQFDVSDNGATDLVSDIDIGVSFPAGNSTTRSAIVDLPREFVANTPAVQACLSELVMVADPQANCPDGANLGTATATSPLLPYPLTGDVIGEDVGGTLPNIYMVFKDPDIGLDTRIRGSASVMKTGTGTGLAAGDFIRTTMNLGSDGGPLDLPSLPLTGLVLNLHQEDPGVMLPDGSTSLGSIIKVGTTYACNSTASARFILNAWSGATTQLVSPPVAFNCGANGQTVSNQIGINSGPANGSTVTTSSVTFVMQNNHTAAVRLRVGLDNGDNALNGIPSDSPIEPNTISTTAVGATRSVTYSGLVDGRVYKFLVQSNAGTTLIDQERRTFKVDLP